MCVCYNGVGSWKNAGLGSLCTAMLGLGAILFSSDFINFDYDAHEEVRSDAPRESARCVCGCALGSSVNGGLGWWDDGA